MIPQGAGTTSNQLVAGRDSSLGPPSSMAFHGGGHRQLGVGVGTWPQPLIAPERLHRHDEH